MSPLFNKNTGSRQFINVEVDLIVFCIFMELIVKKQREQF